MTDLEKFIDTYKQFGIEIKTFIEGDEINILLGDAWEPDRNDITESDKFYGHPGFYSTVEFSLDGEFIRQGFWE